MWARSLTSPYSFNINIILKVYYLECITPMENGK